MKKKLRKFGSGGMPPIGDSVASGNRVSKQVGEETKRMMPPKRRSGMPPIGDSVASGNRMSKENAKDAAAVKKYAKGGKAKAYAKGGKVKKYADGDLVMGDAASDTSGLGLGLGAPKDIGAELRRAMTDKELMDANLAAVRAREAADMAKAASKPKAASAKPKPKLESEAPKAKTEPSKLKAVAPKADARPSAGERARTQMKTKLGQGARALGSMLKAPFQMPKKGEGTRSKAQEEASTAKRRQVNRDYTNYAKGGAAKRADGIARKGHTKGKMR